MNSRISVVLSLAFLISSAASYLVYRISQGKAGSPAPTTFQIVVAARDLEIGAIVREPDLKIANWTGPAPKGSNAKKAGFLKRGVVSAIYEGEAVTENRLASAGSGGGLAAMIPPGMRACAVKVNEVVGVAGFVIPGMRVDVLITGIPPGVATGTEPAVRTLLQNIEVLSAGGNIDKDKEGKPQQVQVVNLLVTPDQAEILSLAGNETRIQLVLRNPMDTAITQARGTGMAELFGLSKERPAARNKGMSAIEPRPIQPANPVIAIPPSPAVETVDVLNGLTRTQARFESPRSTR
jgi:pilus assembly protein CpaB